MHSLNKVKLDSVASASSKRVSSPLDASVGIFRAIFDRLAVLASMISFKELVLTLMLLSVLMMSAIGVVYSSHLSRQLFTEQALLLDRNDQLQLEWAKLLLEQGTMSAPSHIENVAVGDLRMVLPEVAEIELIR